MKFSVITPTHNPKWLSQTWESLRTQTYPDWEWVVVANHALGDETQVTNIARQVTELVGSDPRVLVYTDMQATSSVGQRKKNAFGMGGGDVLVELDHDDLLLPNCLALLAEAFTDPKIGFAYTDFADFEEGGQEDGGQENGKGGKPNILSSAFPFSGSSPSSGPPVLPSSSSQGLPRTYRHPESRPGWVANGFQFYDADIMQGVRPGRYECVLSFPPSAMAFSTVFWAPNHVRAWRRSVYQELGGHDPAYTICDDHELLTRTYLHTEVKHIPLPTYLYRFGENTYTQRADEIRLITMQLQRERLMHLALRECRLRNLLALDLGGQHSTPVITDSKLASFTSVDVALPENSPGIRADLRGRWPMADNSAFVIRAHDFLEHLPDKMHTMSEIARVLAPGGWLLSFTPSTDGRGAFQDPTHVSFWNQNSYWYWTRRQQQQYLPKIEGKIHPRFQEVMLSTYFPSDWHKENNISYVEANLINLKDGYSGPGEKFI